MASKQFVELVEEGSESQQLPLYEPEDQFPKTKDKRSRKRCYIIAGIVVAAIVVGIIIAVIVISVVYDNEHVCSTTKDICSAPKAASKPYSHFLWHANSPSYTNGTRIYLGNGCFWERQFAYTNLEEQQLKRSPANVSALVGYAGSKCTGRNGLVCYHGGGGSDYGALGQAEVVQVQLDWRREAAQFQALVANFFGSFKYDSVRGGMARPDDFSVSSGDHGAAYRSLIGIPGGVDGNFYGIVKAVNSDQDHPMKLKKGKGQDADEFNTVYVMDSCAFPFYRGEQYHQFHSNFFGGGYGSKYLKDLYNTMKKNGRIDSTGCIERAHQ